MYLLRTNIGIYSRDIKIILSIFKGYRISDKWMIMIMIT